MRQTIFLLLLLVLLKLSKVIARNNLLLLLIIIFQHRTLRKLARKVIMIADYYRAPLDLLPPQLFLRLASRLRSRGVHVIHLMPSQSTVQTFIVHLIQYCILLLFQAGPLITRQIIKMASG